MKFIWTLNCEYRNIHRNQKGVPPEMIAVLDEKRDTKPPVPAHSPSPRLETLFDPWADWKPSWTRQDKTPHDFQEKRSPSKKISVRLTAERSVEKCHRRIVDSRLWEAMSAPEQEAALEIALAYETMGRGLGYVQSDWQRIPGCKGASQATEMHSRLINQYIDWTKACHKKKVSHAMIVDILVFGFSCRKVDHDRRMRSGSARQNLLAGLSLYSRLRGWIR